jgi:transposase
MTNPLYVGIDTSSKLNTAVLLDSEGDRVNSEPITFRNNQIGAECFTRYVILVIEEHSFDSLSIGLEATSVYGWHLQFFLSSHPDLKKFEPKIYAINPRLIKGFKKAYPDLPKTDDVDAFVIADRLRFGRLPASCKVDHQYLPLQRLTRFRFHLMQTIAREKSYFLTQLFLKFSNYSHENPFSNIFGTASGAILTEFHSVEEIATTSLEELACFLAKKSKNRFVDPTSIAKELKKIANCAYRLPTCLKEPINLILGSSLETIRALEAQVKRIDKAIERELAGIKHTILSINGIGPVFAAGIIAEIGDVSWFKNQAALSKFAGLFWKRHQSSEFEAEETRLAKTGNKYLRYYLVEAANSMRIHNPDYRTYYLRKYAESKKHRHKRALVLSARKLVRLIYSLLRSKKLYELPKVVA